MTVSDSVSEAVARRIAKLVRDLPPGARLGSKADLITLTGVSEGTLNITLRLLQTRGLIRLKSGPGGGVFATEQSPIARLGNAVLELDNAALDVAAAAQVRNSLEYEIVFDACYFRTEAQLAKMEAHLDSLRETLEAKDPTSFLRANWALHREIASCTPNYQLSSLYTGLLDYIESHTLRVVGAPGHDIFDFHEDRYQIHRKLVESISQRDQEAALPIIYAHNKEISSSSSYNS